MASITDIIDLTTIITGHSSTDVRNRARILREQSLLPKSGPGRSVAQIKYIHGVRLIMGVVLQQVPAIEIAKAVKKFEGIPWPVKSDHAKQVSKTLKKHQIATPKTLGEMLVLMIRCLADNMHKDVMDVLRFRTISFFDHGLYPYATLDKSFPGYEERYESREQLHFAQGDYYRRQPIIDKFTDIRLKEIRVTTSVDCVVFDIIGLLIAGETDPIKAYYLALFDSEVTER